jgi:hypothetical protein
MSALRWTNRLHQHLQSHGQSLWIFDCDERSYLDREIVEAELHPQSRNDITDFYGLLNILREIDDDQAYVEVPTVRTLQRSVPLKSANPDWEDNVIVLWLSETVFVIRVCKGYAHILVLVSTG